MEKLRVILSRRRPKNETEVVGQLLANRGIKTKKAREEFLNPKNPQKMRNEELGIRNTEIRKAVQRIKKTKKTGERIIIYGDYDADGICGTAVLWEALHETGYNALPYIPERFSEGYGLNLESIKKLKEADPTIGLIITVDHGIVARNKLPEIRKLGLDIIITDHHQPENGKPAAAAVIHTTKIGGAAVAWVLAREFATIEDHLALVAIGTISDQLPLQGPNRAIVSWGLGVLRRTKRVGLVSLFETAGLNQPEIGTYEVNFMIAPRLNATGRMVHAIDALRLLCTPNRKRASELAQKINEVNTLRQKTLTDSVLSARKKVDEESLIFIWGDYHEGVVGLVASRLVDEFWRPAVVVSRGEEFSKASARSVPGFNIVEHIRTFKELLVEGGGHPMAAGFTIRTENLEIFSQKLQNLARKKLTKAMLSPKLKIDCQINLDQATLGLAEKLKQFEPTGIGNPEPTFLTEKVFIQNARVVGKEGKHLKLWLTQPRVTSNESRAIESIWFGMGSLLPKLSPDKPVDVVYTIMLDEWNGRKSVKLKIKDIKIS